jgi:hypothetical protein
MPCQHPIEVLLRRSRKAEKKYDAVVRGRTVSFGARGMSDFTLHKDPERRERYLQRHRRREDWTPAGLRTPGFWSRWLLWNQPSLEASRRDMQRRFCLKISRGGGGSGRER